MPIPDHYLDDAAVAAATDAIIDQTGSKVMQIHRFDSNDNEHVFQLLEFFDPQENCSILDLACGVGEIARIMHCYQDDLRFTLNNIGEYQLSQCPPDMPQLPGDFHNLPCPDASFDAVMLCYAVGHSHIDILFNEISRVLRPGGHFYFYDILDDGIGKCGLRKLEYTPYTLPEVIDSATTHWMQCLRVKAAPTDIVPPGFFITAPDGCLNGTCSYAAVFQKAL